MIPWHKVPGDLQKAVLAMIVCFGGASAGCRLFPVVCDPAPPPSVSPMICDPPPPPRTPAVTPMICDPAPPPSRTPTVTPMIFDPAPPPSPTPTVTPMICDPAPPPSRTPTDTPMICDPPPPPNSEESRAWPAGSDDAGRAAASRLPLAEVRTVEIVWESGSTFTAISSWPGATLTWAATGGTLSPVGDRVVWVVPAAPGRYMLQVVADWGQCGLAVDARVLVVEADGSVVLC